jgi:hypothetical protein
LDIEGISRWELWIGDTGGRDRDADLTDPLAARIAATTVHACERRANGDPGFRESTPGPALLT